MRGVVELVAASAAVGRRLGSGAVTDVEVMLGALAVDTGHARAALDSLGVTLEELTDAARGLVAVRPPDTADDGMTFSPNAQQVLHRAYGYALAQDRGHATATDVLVALLWHDPVSSALAVLERCGVMPQELATALGSQGVVLPDLPLPRWVEVAYGPRVSFPAALADEVLGHLTATVGARHEWGFNVEGSTMWVHGEQAANLPHHVLEVAGADVVAIDETWARPVRVDAGEAGG